MIKVYFNEKLQRQSDILNILDDAEIAIVREDGFSSTEQILREKFEATISFTGLAYSYVCGLIKENPCVVIDVRIEFSCDLQFNGTMALPKMEFTIGAKRCICKVGLKDNSFSAYLRDYFNVDIPLYATKTLNCEPINTRIQNFLMPNDPAVPGNTSQIFAFDALDILQYMVEYVSDNRFTVVSTFLTANKIAISTGSNMHNAAGTSITDVYPTMSFDRLFTEIRKKKRTFKGIEYDQYGVPYLSVELEEDYFADVELFAINDIPKGSVQTYDIKRNFNEIITGSETYEVQDNSEIYYPQTTYAGFNKASFIGCGTCVGDKDSKLETKSEFIIDSNVFYEAINWSPAAEYPNDSEIFMFEYEVVNGLNYGKVTLDSGTGNYYYNAGFTNDQVLESWLSYFGKCIAIQRNSKYGFLARSTDFLTTNGDITYACGDSHLTFSQIIYDNEGSLSNGTFNNYASPCSPFLVNDNNTRFIVSEVGNYNFQAKIVNIKQVGGSLETNDVTHELHIYVYTDSTYGTPIMDFSDSVTVPLGYDVASLSVETGDIALAVGNLVVVYQKVSIGSGFFLEDFVYTPEYKTFELISDDFACESVEYNDQNSKPHIITFDYPLCADDYKAMQLNKKGYINLAGYRQWIKEVTYRHKKISTITLMGNDIIDDC